MVYAHDSKSCLARDGGSSPLSGTKTIEPRACLLAIIVFAGVGRESECGHLASRLGRASRAERSEERRRRTSSWPSPSGTHKNKTSGNSSPEVGSFYVRLRSEKRLYRGSCSSSALVSAHLLVDSATYDRMEARAGRFGRIADVATLSDKTRRRKCEVAWPK